MKKFIISMIALVAFSNGAFAAEKVYGQLFMSGTEKALSFDRAAVGVQASLGGSASADLAYDGAANSLLTAKVAYGGLLGGDSLSLGLQANAYDLVLDSALGQSALSCYSCVHHKSAIYANKGLALQANEGNNFAASWQYAASKQVGLVLGGEYDHASDHLLAKAAALIEVGQLKAVVSTKLDSSVLDYSLAGHYDIQKGFGAFGKYAKGGALTVGPTYAPTSGLLVALTASRPAAGAEYAYGGNVSANF